MEWKNWWSNIQHSTFNIQHSTFNIQHSTFNIQHFPLTPLYNFTFSDLTKWQMLSCNHTQFVYPWVSSHIPTVCLQKHRSHKQCKVLTWLPAFDHHSLLVYFHSLPVAYLVYLNNVKQRSAFIVSQKVSLFSISTKFVFRPYIDDDDTFLEHSFQQPPLDLHQIFTDLCRKHGFEPIDADTFEWACQHSNNYDVWNEVMGKIGFNQFKLLQTFNSKFAEKIRALVKNELQSNQSRESRYLWVIRTHFRDENFLMRDQQNLHPFLPFEHSFVCSFHLFAQNEHFQRFRKPRRLPSSSCKNVECF